MLQTNTGEADLRDLHASLVATLLKLRMQAYVSVTRVTAFLEIRIPIGLETRK